jgi:hypothetical protein
MWLVEMGSRQRRRVDSNTISRKRNVTVTRTIALNITIKKPFIKFNFCFVFVIFRSGSISTWTRVKGYEQNFVIVLPFTFKILFEQNSF